jgi:hypothetical protein
MASAPDRKHSPQDLEIFALMNRSLMRAERRPSVEEDKLEEVRKHRQKARRALVRAKENRAQVLRSHVLGLVMLRRWRDGKGRSVGIVDHNGLRIQAPIQQALLRMGALTQVDDSMKLPENVQRRLMEACRIMDPALFSGVKKVINPVEEALSRLRGKVVDLEENPEYLFEFEKGGNLRGDLTEILLLMRSGKQTSSEILQTNPWVIAHNALAHFPADEEISRRMDLMNQEQEAGSEWGRTPTECLAQFLTQERMRSDILKKAANRKKPLNIAQRMPGLMAGNLDLMTHGIAGQTIDIFGDQDLELGETDAESMCIALDTVNRCLLALIDIRRTKQVIPSLAL